MFDRASTFSLPVRKSEEFRAYLKDSARVRIQPHSNADVRTGLKDLEQKRCAPSKFRYVGQRSVENKAFAKERLRRNLCGVNIKAAALGSHSCLHRMLVC